jgi:hypothetical protein
MRVVRFKQRSLIAVVKRLAGHAKGHIFVCGG